MPSRRRVLSVALVLGALTWSCGTAWADITMKVLVVNPSENEVKEFRIRSPLPPEVKPAHVLDADGLSVEYDSQAGVYLLVGTVTLKPKESVTRRIVLEDVWMIPVERLSNLHREIEDITKKLAGTSYAEEGSVLAIAIERNLSHIDESQQQPLTNPQQHISLYHENTKTLQLVESDLVSLRQLMVMAALATSSSPVITGDASGAGAGHERGSLSVLATWRLIFIILGLLGAVSLSFFVVWQHQLKLQLAKQAATEQTAESETLTNGHGTRTSGPGNVPASAVTPRLQPKAPLSS